MIFWFILLIVSYVHGFPTLEHIPRTRLDEQSNITSLEVEGLPSISSIHSLTSFQQSIRHDNTQEFPSFFGEGHWKGASLILAFAIGVYCFTFLALICDKYFLPCIERISEALNLSQDIAAATFMAMATSAPEFFVNVIGTFITESDIGIGTVVGSSLFNTLGVAAIGSIAATKPIQVDWWPVTRDSCIYIISISILVVLSWDNYIYWYEGMILFIVYIIYFIVMFNNTRISRFVKGIVERYTVVSEKMTLGEKQAAVGESTPPIVYVIDEPIKYYIERRESVKAVEPTNSTRLSYGYYCLKVWYIIIWPLKILLRCTIPDPAKYPKLFPVTFIMCILFMGTNSYVVSWMISIIGHTLEIPDLVLGLTFLAAGSCLPEAISIIIQSRKGNGQMGVSNALGANSMNILLSLGLPWFIKTLIVGGNEIDKKFLELDSRSIEYTILGLTLVAVSLFATLYFNRFMLSKRTGVILLVVYVIFLFLAISSELLFTTSAVTS